MNNSIFRKAFDCKEFAEKEIAITRQIYVDRGQYRGEINHVDGNIKKYEKLLLELRREIREVYPKIEVLLGEEMDKYDDNPAVHLGKIDTIVKILCLLEEKRGLEEEQRRIIKGKQKKIFISHSSNDGIIVKEFIKDILQLGCGLKDEDIFCTVDSTAIKTGEDFREQIIKNMRECDYILLLISDSYRKSEVCCNEIGAAWALDKKIIPFIFPNTSFNQMGFFNVVKQGAAITDGSKLDELYEEFSERYSLQQNWPRFNKQKDEFIQFMNSYKPE